MKLVCYTFLFITATITQHSFAQESENDVAENIPNGINSFGLKLNKHLLENNVNRANIFFSPFNLYSAFALLHLGTDGATRDELTTNVLGISTTYQAEKFHEAMKTLLLSSQKYRETRSFTSGKVEKVNATKINIAEGIFLQNGVTLKDSFVANAKSYYNSEVTNVDFINKGQEATDIINQYVANKTENLIPQLFTSPQSPDTRILLATALYFKSIWESKFEPTATHPDTFFTENGNITVDMMHKIEEIPYANFPDFNAESIKLWFAEKNSSLIIVKPGENQTVDDLVKNLTPENITTIISQTVKNSHVDLKLPKTQISWSKTINSEIIKLGVKKLFTEGAELNNMVDDKNLKVTEIIHATNIKITEDGTEASAITTIRIGLRSGAYSKHVVFHINRPFLIFIYNHYSNSILFQGIVYNPIGN